MEERKKQLEDSKMKMMEERTRQQADLQKKQEELKIKQEQQKADQQKRIAEAKAMMAIRRTMQKVRQATPDSFAEAHAELTQIMEAEFKNCSEAGGKQVKEEADKIVETVKARVDAVFEQRRKAQEEKERKERERLELEARAKALAEELQGLIAEAVAAGKAVSDAVASLADFAGNGREEAEAAVAAADGAERTAKEKFTRCTDFILEHRATLRTVLPDPAAAAKAAAPKVLAKVIAAKALAAKAPAQAPVQAPEDGEAAAAAAEEPPAETVQQATQRAIGELAEAKKATQAAAAKRPGLKARALRRAAALEQTTAVKAMFKRYDRDGDKKLNKAEIAAYAKGEFSFALQPALIDRFLETCDQDAGAKSQGAGEEDFLRVRQFVGLKRQLKVMDKLREKRLEREKAVEKARGQLKDAIAAIAKEVQAAEAAVSEAEAQVNPLGKKVRELTTPAIYELADKVEPVVRASSSTAAAARKAFEGLVDGFEAGMQDTLRAVVKSDQFAKKIHMQTLRFAPRISRAENLLDRFRRDAERKEELKRLEEQRKVEEEKRKAEEEVKKKEAEEKKKAEEEAKKKEEEEKAAQKAAEKEAADEAKAAEEPAEGEPEATETKDEEKMDGEGAEEAEKAEDGDGKRKAGEALDESPDEPAAKAAKTE